MEKTKAPADKDLVDLSAELKRNGKRWSQQKQRQHQNVSFTTIKQNREKRKKARVAKLNKRKQNRNNASNDDPVMPDLEEQSDDDIEPTEMKSNASNNASNNDKQQSDDGIEANEMESNVNDAHTEGLTCTWCEVMKLETDISAYNFTQSGNFKCLCKTCLTILKKEQN